MAPKLLSKAGLMWSFFVYTLGQAFGFFRRTRALKKRLKRKEKQAAAAAAAAPPQPPRNIVVVGASFAGYYVAQQLAAGLSAAESPQHRVVVVEPSSHFHFTWVLPRMCVAAGHEHKAFIPYGPHLAGAGAADPGRVRWVTGRVASVSRGWVRLQAGDGEDDDGEGEVIAYDYLVVATGSGAGDGLPSRVGAPDRESGLARLRDMQSRIAAAGRIVVVGGGAAGVELAADVKDRYRDSKDVVLVHSRQAVMHRFGPELQAAALKGLRDLGVEVVLNERAAADADGRVVTLRSGRKIECDLFISCVGQRPSSNILADLSPTSISASGHVRVLPTLQVADASLPNVFACGDVADTGTTNPNARAAVKHSMVVADNILAMVLGGGEQEQQLPAKYEPHWADGLIKLTIGLEKSIIQFGDEKNEFFWHAKDKDIALRVDGAWKHFGAVPFEDTTDGLAPYRHAA